MLCVKLTVCFISVLLVPEGLCLGDGTHHASFPGECRSQGSQHCRPVMRYGLVILRCLHREIEKERGYNATYISMGNSEILTGLTKLLTQQALLRYLYKLCFTLWGEMLLNNAILLGYNCEDNYGTTMKCLIWLVQGILEQWIIIYSLFLQFYTLLQQ